MGHYTEVKKSLDRNNGKLSNAIPEEMKGFMSLHNAALKEGALDSKTKELIALGISIGIRCEPCITSHSQSLIKLEVTKEEFEEAIALALFMSGGPATAYGGKALECYDEMTQS